MRQQKGFVLVSVLIITTVSTMLALSQLSENRLQERIAGNQQKEISARLTAEKGLFDAFEFIAAENAAGTSNTAIFSALSASSFSDDENYSIEKLDLSGTNFEFISKGSFQGAVSYLKTSVEAIEESRSSLFTDAVTGCKGVTVKNGKIDSYNSADGYYDQYMAGKNGGVATINSDGNIVFSGSSIIEGNVISSGNISNSSSAVDISGDLTAVGDISLTGITTSGDIHAGGNLNMVGLVANGQNMTVGGDIITENGKKNTINSSIIYGGTDQALTDQEAFGFPTEGIVPPDVTPLGRCDPLDIPTVMTDLNTAMGTATATDYSTLTGSILNFSESSVSSSDGIEVSPVTLSLPKDSGSVSSGTSDIFDEVVSVYIFGAADLTNQRINISGDITIIVQGSITTNSTTLTLTDSTSSLTILTTGQIKMNSNTTTVYTDGNALRINANGEVPLTIYSSYASGTDDDLALAVTSNADIYAKVYAPLGNVSLTGGGNIMGAVRSNVTTFNSSAGQIHYDEALAGINDITDEEHSPASYSSVYYYYPDE